MAGSIETINGMNLFKMKAITKLEFKEDTKGYIKYGKDNLYPAELIRLYDENPHHRAIINRKARYIFGKGIKAVDKLDEQKVNAFIESFNRKENLNKCAKKLTLNTELFNGVFVEVITNLIGEPLEFYFLNSVNCRLNENKDKLYFCKNWTRNIQLKDIKVVEKFNPENKRAGTFFIDFSYYTPSATYLNSIYPIAQYQAVVDDINTDIDISTFNKNYVSNGFSVGKIINFFNGMPDSRMKNEIDNRFKNTYAGEEGESIMISHSDRDDKAPEVVDVSINDLSEKFAFTSKRAQKNIYSGHEMSPELFNIKFDESFLSASTDLVLLQDLFIKGYVEPRQETLIEFLSYLSFLKTGEYLKMEFDPINLIGVDLSNDVDLTQDERRKLKGYEPLTAPKLDVNGLPMPVQANEANDHLKGLTASENRDMQRVVRDYTQKKNGMNEHLAIARLKGYGLSENESKKILGINSGLDAKMSNDIDKILLSFERCAIDDNDADEVLLIEAAHIHNSKDALKYERQIMKFADALVVSVEELDKAVLSALKGNPTLTVDDIATQLNYDAIKISEALARLVKKKLIDNSFKPTQKALDIPSEEPSIKVEVYTVYKYAVNEDKPLLKTGGKSRKFCTDMMRISKLKSWTFEALDNMSNDLGTNVWDYRGGYYTNPNTGVIDPDCRHLFVAITKKRTIKN